MGFSTNRPTDYFAMGIQSAKDTEASTFKFWRHSDGTGMENDPDIQTEREGGDGQEAGLRYKKLIKNDGQANANARGEITALSIGGALGKTATILTRVSDTDVAPTAAVKMRFVPNATLPYFTFEQRFADEIERNTNCKITQAEISGEAGMPLEVAIQFVGGGTVYRRAIASALTPTREGGDPIFFPRGSYVIDGAGNTKLTKYKVTAKRNVDDGIQTVDLWREDVIELNADYDLDFTLKYEDATLYEKVQYGGGTMVPIPLATGSFKAYSNNGQAAGATAYRAIDVKVPFFQYVGAKVNKLDPDGKTMYLDVAAMTIKNATDTIAVDVIVASQAAFF